jgi:hypothetical protein
VSISAFASSAVRCAVRSSLTSSNEETTVGGMSPIGGSRSAEATSESVPRGVSKSMWMPSTRRPVDVAM